MLCGGRSVGVQTQGREQTVPCRRGVGVHLQHPVQPVPVSRNPPHPRSPSWAWSCCLPRHSFLGSAGSLNYLKGLYLIIISLAIIRTVAKHSPPPFVLHGPQGEKFITSIILHKPLGCAGIPQSMKPRLGFCSPPRSHERQRRLLPTATKPVSYWLAM